MQVGEQGDGSAGPFMILPKGGDRKKGVMREVYAWCEEEDGEAPLIILKCGLSQ